MKVKCCFFFLLLWQVAGIRAQNVLSMLESISSSLPFSVAADSLKATSIYLKQPLLPAEQQRLIQQYNQAQYAYKQSIGQYLAQYPDRDTAAFLVLNYYFNIQKDSGFLRTALNLFEVKGTHSFYTQYIAEELNGLDSGRMGKIIPRMTLWDKNGQMQYLPTGQKTLLLFWASWCVPCRAENSLLKNRYGQLAQKGIKLVSVNLDEEKNSWLRASGQDGISWEDWFAGKAWNSRPARFFTIHQIPQNVLLDEEGKILARNIAIDRL